MKLIKTVRQYLPIAHAFSKACATYDHHAQLQKSAAFRLAQRCNRMLPLTVTGDLLEIGCGTGFLTRHLIDIYDDLSFYITDLAPGMVAFSQNLLAKKGPLMHFGVLNGENLEEVDRFAIIASGLVFQWYYDFDRSVERAMRALKSGGRLICSYLAEGSFPEWKSACELAMVPFTGNQLPSHNALTSYLSSERYHGVIWQESIKLRYPSPLAFFQSLKAIGAHARISVPGQLSPAQLKSLCACWQRSAERAVESTHFVTYAIIQKELQ